MKFEAIGTSWSIESKEPFSDQLQRSILDRIELFDRTYSRFRNDSLVGRMTQGAGVYEFPDDCRELLSFYRKMYDATDGAVTPLVGATLEGMGYDKEYSLVPGMVQKVQAWDEGAMSWNDATAVTSQAVTLDFGAAGKGYLVDIIGQLLDENSVHEYVIDASGDMQIRGGGSHAIGLEDPNDSSRVIGVAKVKDASLCASATNRRQWGEGLHHVIDGRTGKPANDVIATWVVADSTMVADGIATALFFNSAESLHKLGVFEFVRLFRDGKVEHSRDFVGELFI